MAAKRKARAPRKPRPKAPPAPVQAQVLAGGRASSHPLPAEGEVVIGRGTSAGLRVAHRSVAARHAVLLMGAGDRVMIEDLGGGTAVDGRPLRPGERAPVLPG